MPSSSDHGSCLGLEVLHDEHKGLDKFGLLEKLVDLSNAAARLGGSVGIVSSVSGLGLMDHSYFLGLVVGGEQAGSLDRIIRIVGDMLLDLVGIFGRLEANKGVLRFGGVVLVFLDSQILDGADLSDVIKDISEHLLVSVWRDTPHEKVASLLGVLELEDLFCEVYLPQRFLYIDLLSIGFRSMHLRDGLIGAVGVLVANEGEEFVANLGLI